MGAYIALIGITIVSYFLFYYQSINKGIKASYSTNYSGSVLLRTDKVEAKTITVFFVIYILLLGLRNINVGIDTRSYINSYFYKLMGVDWGYLFEYTADEIGFSVLTKIISMISGSTQFYLFVLAVVSVMPIAYLYRKEAKDALLCCSFFLISLLFEAFFSALREGVAIGLVAPAYYFTKRKQLIPFILTVVFASIFHLSALIVLLLYPVYHTKLRFRRLWIIAPLMFIVYRYNDIIFDTLLVNMGGKYASKYLTYGYNETGQFGLLFLFILIFAYCFIMMDESKADDDDLGLRSVLVLATMLQFFAPLHVMASRMNYYFIVFIPLALTRTNYRCRRLFRQVAIIARYTMIAFFIFYFFFMKGDSLQIMEYSFFFQEGWR